MRIRRAEVAAYNRAGAQIAGATVDPAYRVWVEDWAVEAQNADATQLTIRADSGEVSVDFTLDQAKPPALQGDNGLSPKSAEPGNASYYYSLPLLETSGTLTVGGESFDVSGTTWMDHEFSTSALGGNALGWDWFGLQLDDNRQLMLGQIRLQWWRDSLAALDDSADGLVDVMDRGVVPIHPLLQGFGAVDPDQSEWRGNAECADRRPTFRRRNDHRVRQHGDLAAAR